MAGIADIDLLERMVSAVKQVQDRLQRASHALDRAELPYAIVGGNAVAAWVASVDETAVRFTRDVDVLIRRADLPSVSKALCRVGLHVSPEDGSFRVRDAIHIVFADERFRWNDVLPNPDVVASEVVGDCRVLSLAHLVQTKLTACRAVDKTHLLDMLDVGLIDETWADRFPPELAARLQQLIDTPDG